jgi:hypothetical protein
VAAAAAAAAAQQLAAAAAAAAAQLALQLLRPLPAANLWQLPLLQLRR